MAARLATLQKRATATARAHGHSLSEWFPSEARPGRAFARCTAKTCIAELCVTPRPTVAEVELIGTALALDCPYLGIRHA